MSTQLQMTFSDSRQTQTVNILRHLQAGRAINPLECLRLYGCFRLGARIWDLKQQGHKIKSEMIDVGNGKRVASYSLEKSL